MRALFWVATLLVSSQAAAQNARIAEAWQAFEDVDFERVIPLLEKALAAGPSELEKVEAFVLMGQVHLAYGRDHDAEWAFIQALTIDRDYILPETVAPKISAAFETARAKVPLEVEAVGAAPVGDGPFTDPGHGLPPAEQNGVDDSTLSQWWLWASVGAVVAGVSGILAWQLSRPSEPAHDHGVFRF